MHTVKFRRNVVAYSDDVPGTGTCTITLDTAEGRIANGKEGYLLLGTAATTKIRSPVSQVTDVELVLGTKWHELTHDELAPTSEHQAPKSWILERPSSEEWSHMTPKLACQGRLKMGATARKGLALSP